MISYFHLSCCRLTGVRKTNFLLPSQMWLAIRRRHTATILSTKPTSTLTVENVYSYTFITSNKKRKSSRIATLALLFEWCRSNFKTYSIVPFQCHCCWHVSDTMRSYNFFFLFKFYFLVLFFFFYWPRLKKKKSLSAGVCWRCATTLDGTRDAFTSARERKTECEKRMKCDQQAVYGENREV